jgi:hypothetical protein
MLPGSLFVLMRSSWPPVENDAVTVRPPAAKVKQAAPMGKNEKSELSIILVYTFRTNVIAAMGIIVDNNNLHGASSGKVWR